MLNRQLCTAVALATLAMPGVVSAQAPWTVTITPTLNPLPIGLCGAVQLRLVDARGNTGPRNPAGYLMGLADFDMSVTASDPAAVVGQQIDASHWSVCACQAGAAGTIAIITASYPARRLLPAARTPGVSFQTTETVALAGSKGAVNPPGCGVPPATTVAVSASQSAPIPIAASASPTKTATVARGAGAPPVQTAPSGTPQPPGQQLTGPPPTGVTVGGTPIVASIAWNAVANAQRYAVWRGYTGTVSVERTPAAFTATQFLDTIPDPRITFYYTVMAHYANGTSGAAQAVYFTSPPMVNPTGFTVTQKGQTSSTQAEVEFAWNAVPGAMLYRLDGPGIPGTGDYSSATTRLVPTVPRGAGTWMVQTVYPGNFTNYASATTASGVIRILPQPSQPWLTKPNGAGSEDNVQMPREGAYHCFSFFFCTYESVFPNQLQHPYDVNYATWLGVRQGMGYTTDRFGLETWLDIFGLKLWDDPIQQIAEAVYGNPGDLGVGRRSYCAQMTRTTQLPGVYTVCYASAHGIAPGQPGFNDPQVITNPGAGISNDLLLTMVITKEPTGSTFMVFAPTLKYTLSPTVTLDIQGPKYVPHACLSCHGGKYNATTHKVDGASFLPIDAGLQAFASPAAMTQQQTAIRKINEIIVKSGSSPAVVAYINGLYGNAVHVPNKQATPDYVPAGWQAQAGLYRSIVRPYCAMCHLTATPDISFASWGNFQGNAARINAAVCVAHTMPHAELQFKEFWLKDTGALYLPGLLAASLGFPKC